MNLPDGFALGAVLAREGPRDAFVSNRFADFSGLPRGASVGTSRLRRVAQFLALRPDLRIAPLRGNLDTRLASSTPASMPPSCWPLQAWCAWTSGIASVRSSRPRR